MVLLGVEAPWRKLGQWRNTFDGNAGTLPWSSFSLSFSCHGWVTFNPCALLTMFFTTTGPTVSKGATWPHTEISEIIPPNKFSLVKVHLPQESAIVTKSCLMGKTAFSPLKFIAQTGDHLPFPGEPKISASISAYCCCDISQISLGKMLPIFCLLSLILKMMEYQTFSSFYVELRCLNESL